MVAFADTGFIASLYLEESTSKAADAALGTKRVPLPLTPLAALELRNAFNRAVQRQRITAAQRDALWQDVEADIASGFLVLTPVASDQLHHKARQLSDRHMQALGDPLQTHGRFLTNASPPSSKQSSKPIPITFPPFMLKRAVEVNRKERKEHKDKGMWLISLAFRLTRRVIA
jgi:predicted nucleic acid-binding protein